MVDRERLLQSHQGVALLQEVQAMEVYENVEEDNQAPKQNEGSKLFRGEALYFARPLFCALDEASSVHVGDGEVEIRGLV